MTFLLILKSSKSEAEPFLETGLKRCLDWFQDPEPGEEDDDDKKKEGKAKNKEGKAKEEKAKDQ